MIPNSKHKEFQLIYIYRRAKWTHFSWTYLLHCSKKILKHCTLGFEIKCVGRIFGKSWNLILHLISYRRCHCCRLPYTCLWQRYTSAETEESNVKYRKAFSRIHVVITFRFSRHMRPIFDTSAYKYCQTSSRLLDLSPNQSLDVSFNVHRRRNRYGK